MEKCSQNWTSALTSFSVSCLYGLRGCLRTVSRHPKESFPLNLAMYSITSCGYCAMGSIGSTRSRDRPLISLLFSQPRDLAVATNVTFYNPLDKLICIKIWMPCSCHTLHQCNSVHFTKLYFYTSVTAKSIFKRKFFGFLQQIEKTSSKILQCIFMISENFSFVFQEKKILSQLKQLYKKYWNFQLLLGDILTFLVMLLNL